MAMGNRPSERQSPLFVPSIAPGVYFRLLMAGYFEGIGSEREIALHCADSRSLSSFLGYGPTEVSPVHSALSKTRRLPDLETHGEIFGWILSVLGRRSLLKGKTVAIDATTLEANATLHAIVRKDDVQSRDAFLDGLANASGIETPTREDRAKVDKQRKKKESNDDWTHSGNLDARITKMKDGRAHLAHKVEHASDLDTTAVMSVTVQPVDRGDTASVCETPAEASDHLGEAVVDADGIRDVVLAHLAELGFLTCASKPNRGRDRRKGKGSRARRGECQSSSPPRCARTALAQAAKRSGRAQRCALLTLPLGIRSPPQESPIGKDSGWKA